jgi:hypothetical protein
LLSPANSKRAKCAMWSTVSSVIFMVIRFGAKIRR